MPHTSDHRKLSNSVSSQRIRKSFAFLPALFIMLMIFRFSSQNADDSSVESLRITRDLLVAVRDQLQLSWTPEELSFYIEQSEFFVRKLAHFSEYALLGISLILPLIVYYSDRFRRKILFLISWGICAAYAVLDEFHQSFSPGRSPQLRDVVIDSCGALAGILLGLLILHLRARLRKRQRQH
mgnify:CR=1 FL=1